MKLFVNGRAAELELKPLEVLRYLLQHAGEAIGKDDLIKAVWPGHAYPDARSSFFVLCCIQPMTSS